jgi:hypothetical protein
VNYLNIYTPVQHIRRPQVNPGGLCWVVFARWEDVELWPIVDPLTGICKTDIKLRNGKTWFELKATDKGRMFTEVQKQSAAGPYWEMQVTGYVGGNNSVLTLSSGAMTFHQYVVMFKDRDGQIRFIGSDNTGADVEINYTSGDKEASRKRSFVFSWEHHLPAPIYAGKLDDIEDDVILPPFAALREFNDDFNLDFN